MLKDKVCCVCGKPANYLVREVVGSMMYGNGNFLCMQCKEDLVDRGSSGFSIEKYENASERRSRKRARASTLKPGYKHM